VPAPDEVAYLWERWWEPLAAALSDQHPAARLGSRDRDLLAASPGPGGDEDMT
jgi:hypothetical protein